MTIKEVRYRPAWNEPWKRVPFPGPEPQSRSKTYPTSTTYCTCGHNGPEHRTQYVRWMKDIDTVRKRYRGECMSYQTAHGRQCLCTWFTEGLGYEETLKLTEEAEDATWSA